MRDNNSARDVLTIHCHVYNTTSPGFSVMTKGRLHAPGLCVALESVSNQERGHNSIVHFNGRKCYLHISKSAHECRGTKHALDIWYLCFFFCDGKKKAAINLFIKINKTIKVIVSVKVKSEQMVCWFPTKSIFTAWSPGESSYSWAIKTLGFNYLTLWKCRPVGGYFIYSTPNQRLETWLLISLTRLFFERMCVCVRACEMGD